LPGLVSLGLDFTSAARSPYGFPVISSTNIFWKRARSISICDQPRQEFIRINIEKQLSPSMAEAMILPSASADEGDIPHGYS